jgi:hypothetical protein
MRYVFHPEALNEYTEAHIQSEPARVNLCQL